MYLEIDKNECCRKEVRSLVLQEDCVSLLTFLLSQENVPPLDVDDLRDGAILFGTRQIRQSIVIIITQRIVSSCISTRVVCQTIAR
jgi:hypothetical protein